MMIKRLDLKLGSMRKAQDFIVYPASRDEGSKVLIQSDKRIAQIDIETGEGMLSSGKAGHPGFIELMEIRGAKPIKVDTEVIEAIKAARPKSGDMIGPGVSIA
jgi:hypothetical protein